MLWKFNLTDYAKKVIKKYILNIQSLKQTDVRKYDEKETISVKYITLIDNTIFLQMTASYYRELKEIHLCFFDSEDSDQQEKELPDWW